MAELRPAFQDRAFTLSPPGAGARPAFLMCWSCRSAVTVATGSRQRHGAEVRFSLDSPIMLMPLVDYAA
eukprot:2524616-Pyramimonas_sp.AAC.1